MKKTILILTLSILLFSSPPAKARMAMTIHATNSENNNSESITPEDSVSEANANSPLFVELDPNNNPDEVIALFEPFKDNEDNKSFIFYSSLGLAYKNKGRFKDAIAVYVRSLELKPNEPGTQYNLGIACLKNNEGSRALRYFLKSIIGVLKRKTKPENNLKVNWKVILKAERKKNQKKQIKHKTKNNRNPKKKGRPRVFEKLSLQIKQKRIS